MIRANCALEERLIRLSQPKQLSGALGWLLTEILSLRGTEHDGLITRLAHLLTEPRSLYTSKYALALCLLLSETLWLLCRSGSFRLKQRIDLICRLSTELRNLDRIGALRLWVKRSVRRLCAYFLSERVVCIHLGKQSLLAR